METLTKDMNGNDVMLNAMGLSEAKRALLEKHLQGNLSQAMRGGIIIPKRSLKSAAPLSFSQQQMWLLSQLMPDTPVYNESVTIHLPGLLNVAALEQSLNEIIRRHEAWRTSFPLVDEQPIQIIQPPSTLKLPVVDLRDLPETQREAEALRLATEDSQILFDLASGSLMRAILVRLRDEEHRLYLTLHHIIFDGMSVYQVFLSELHTLYEAFSNGQPSSLPELSIQYADFAVWQREQLQGKVLSDQLAFWKKQLDGAPTTLELLADHPRPQIPTYRGAIHRLTLSKTLTDSLRDLSRREGVTLYMILLAAFNTLLYRYTGQEDILIGTATEGRKHAELQKLMGVFINTIVMRTNLTGNPSFHELLGRVREVILDTHAHQDVPFEYLVKELHPERELGQNPLFQVLLMLEPPIPVLPSGWTLTNMDVDTGTSKFDLSLIIEDRPEGFIGRFEYSTDLFDAASIARMAAHWETLLEGIVANPEQRIADLPLLTETERQQLVVEWNATQTDYPADTCIHELFAAQVEQTPEAIAVIWEDRQLTYRELNQQANQLAHHLQRLGVGPDVLVGICVERSLEMVVGFLGILKAGGAYVPLDPTYPQERLAFMLEDTQTPVLLTQRQLITRLPQHAAKVVYLDDGGTELMGESQENPSSGAQAENLAYVIYTSGSTGRPKGVAVPHRAVNRLIFNTNYIQIEPSDRIGQASNASFDAATFEVWGALLHGAQLVGITKDVALSPQDFATCLHENRISALFLTTALFNHLANHVPWAFRSLRHLLFGGEAVDPKWVKEVLKHDPPERLLHVYGPTETTTFASWLLVQNVPEGAATIPIGRPISNTQIYLLDRHLHPVPIGVPGELYIGGPGVARGYLNRPELTAERFVPHPFGDEPGDHLYKTGDQARFLPDGSIEFLGRFDHQVKLRGFRIELGEIESMLGQHPAVRETLVLTGENGRREKSLVAYVVPPQGTDVTPNELRRFLQAKLPEYMVPSDFLLLDSLPLTPNGKVDRRALPAPESSRHIAEETFVSPTLPIHHQLVQIWEELLDVRPIGIRDNFFHLGGHSLLAARLVDRIEQTFGKKIPLSTLFAGPTIEQLTTILQQEDANSAKDTGSRASLMAVQHGKSRRPFFYLHGDYMGGAFYCFTLASNLGSEQPFYVLEPYKFDGLQVPPTFEEMAAAHLRAMRAVQPEGPYLLGGFCNGGLVAYEIARQLHAEGQKVDLLVLIDPAEPAPHSSIRSAISRFCELMGLGQDKQLDWFLRLRHVYKYLRFSDYRQSLKASKSLETTEKTDRRRPDKARFALPKLNLTMPAVEFLRQDWPGIYRWVASAYIPGVYPGKVTLFWATEELYRSTKWPKVTGIKDPEVHVVPGTHLIITPEHVLAVAEHLGTCLSKVQATS